MSLTGRTVAVLGGSSGIGAQVARQAVALGADVVITGRDPDRLSEAAARIRARRAIRFDAHNDTAVEALFADLGPIDHVVSMVGDSMAGAFLTTTPATMRHVLDSKFWANWTIARNAADHLQPGGSITFTAGTGGRPHEISASYIANLAIGALVEGLAVELAPRARANAVAPTFMDTPFWRSVPPADLAATKQQVAAQIPLGRLGTTDEIAAAYLHLMTNTFITGQVLPVDGGIMLH